jgi:prepilin-type N-terminal cleavage/methylation domain-containing protein
VKGESQHDRWSGQAGVTLLELLIAIAILMIVSAGLLGAFAFALSQNKSQGEITTRTAEYCGDKMEQLMALSFSDTQSNTATFPTTSTGGNGLSTGGAIPPSSPVSGYVDYLNVAGAMTTATATGANAPFYTRQWQISTSGNLKTITVWTQAGSPGSNIGSAPWTALVCYKANI